MLIVFAAIHVLAVLVVAWLLAAGDRLGMLGWTREDEAGGGGRGEGGPAGVPPNRPALGRTVPFEPAPVGRAQAPAGGPARIARQACGVSA